jgi:hypothetical protein
MMHPTSAKEIAEMWAHGDPYGGHFLPFKAPPGGEDWQEPGFPFPPAPSIALSLASSCACSLSE